MGRILAAWAAFSVTLWFTGWATAVDPWITYEGYDGPGAGKHIVFVTGDDDRIGSMDDPGAVVFDRRDGP